VGGLINVGVSRSYNASQGNLALSQPQRLGLSAQAPVLLTRSIEQPSICALINQRYPARADRVMYQAPQDPYIKYKGFQVHP
jgi:hypothetical protein